MKQGDLEKLKGAVISMVDICCASLVILLIFFLLAALIVPTLWRYYFRKIFRRKDDGRTVYRDKSGRTVVDVGDGEPKSPLSGIVKARDSGGLKGKPRLVPKPPAGKRGLHKFMYSSMSYSTGDGKKWGKVVVTEKDGKRTVERYGDMAKGMEKVRERDDDFVDVEAEDTNN